MSTVFSECVSDFEGVYLQMCGRTEHNLHSLHEVFYLGQEGCVLEGGSQKMAGVELAQQSRASTAE